MAAIVALNILTHSYVLNNQEEGKIPEYLYGVPTYPNARFYLPMSSLEGDPYVAAFLSDDPVEKVVAFYTQKMKMPPRDLSFGKNAGLVIHQFGLEPGVLPKSINKGVEIFAFNSFNRRVYKAQTKIKIYVPRQEIEETEKNEQKKPPEPITPPAESNTPSFP